MKSIISIRPCRPCAPAQGYEPTLTGRSRSSGIIRGLMAFMALAAGEASAEVAVLPNVTLKAAEVINLWPNTAPNEPGGIGPEHVLPNRPRPFDQITDVTVPTLSVFHPSAETRTGTGILVIPGGGLERLAIEHEGYEVAEWLTAHGITAFVLKHRVPPRSSEQRWKAGVQDAQRAMSLIRARADDWKVDRDAIGSIGFSAGAEINVMLSVYTADGERQYSPVDDADKFATRPDFNIAIYGGGFADPRTNAMREDIATRINSSTPPMFVVHAFDDQAMSSLILMTALKRANVVSELHIFGAGAHGFGVRDTGLPVGNWRELCMNWLDWQGFLDRRAVRSFVRDFVREMNSNSTTLPRLGAIDSSADLETAFAAQRRIVRQTIAEGGEVAGYKGGYTSAAAQASMGITGPLHGVLFKNGRLEAATTPTVALGATRPRMVELEIGYVMATDIGTKLRVPRQATTAVEALVPVIELPLNVSALTDGDDTAVDAVAANIGSDRYIVGDPIAPSTISNLDTLAVSLDLDGQTIHRAKGGDVKGGQAEILMQLINQIIEQGHVIHRGDIIICGALGGAKPERKGHYRADFGQLGRIEFKLE